MDINKLEWSNELCQFFGIDHRNLPSIRNSSDDFGFAEDINALKKVRITGVIGDQQSACMGHGLLEGDVKNTYGTGCFTLMNTGENLIYSNHGLLSTVLYKNKSDCKATYALEGAIESSGSGLKFLQDNLGLFQGIEELPELFNSVKSNGGVFFVPGFSGLFSPHWDSSSRALIIGMSLNTSKGHIIRALYEGIGYRSLEVIESFEKDSNKKVNSIKVDGGMSLSNEFLATQSKILEKVVVRPLEHEVTMLGSAVCAGLYSEIGFFKDIYEVNKKLQDRREEFNEKWDPKERALNISKWKSAIERSKNWNI